MNSLKIVMCGNHETGFEVISNLLKKGIQIHYFVLLDRINANKHNVSGYVQFEPLATEYNISVYYAKSFNLKNQHDILFFQENKFDVLIQGGWQRLFPIEVLKTLSIGAIGGHGSANYLPKGRGRSPLNWALIENHKRFIMNYFIIKPGVDDGDIFCTKQFDINEFDDIKTLYYKISLITIDVLLEWIPKLFANNFILKKQIGNPTYLSKRNPEDGHINWNKPIIDVYNFIRALTKPYPGAFSFINGEKIILWKAQIFDYHIDYPDYEYGVICHIFIDGNFLIKCNGGVLLINKYENIQNQKCVNLEDQLN